MFGIFWDAVRLMFTEPEPRPEPLERNWPRPTTYEEAVDYVYHGIDRNTVDEPMFHFRGGMAIRNVLNLWDPESELSKHMLERFGLCHADDTGGLITQAANARRKGEEYDPSVDVERFKCHWRMMGFDPATMEPLSGDRPTSFRVMAQDDAQVQIRAVPQADRQAQG